MPHCLRFGINVTPKRRTIVLAKWHFDNTTINLYTYKWIPYGHTSYVRSVLTHLAADEKLEIFARTPNIYEYIGQCAVPTRKEDVGHTFRSTWSRSRKHINNIVGVRNSICSHHWNWFDDLLLCKSRVYLPFAWRIIRSHWDLEYVSIRDYCTKPSTKEWYVTTISICGLAGSDTRIWEQKILFLLLLKERMRLKMPRAHSLNVSLEFESRVAMPIHESSQILISGNDT